MNVSSSHKRHRANRRTQTAYDPFPAKAKKTKAKFGLRTQAKDRFERSAPALVPQKWKNMKPGAKLLTGTLCTIGGAMAVIPFIGQGMGLVQGVLAMACGDDRSCELQLKSALVGAAAIGVAAGSMLVSMSGTPELVVTATAFSLMGISGVISGFAYLNTYCGGG